jgi:hypothetical protein
MDDLRKQSSKTHNSLKDLERYKKKSEGGVLKSGSSPRFGDAHFSLGRNLESGEADEK